MLRINHISSDVCLNLKEMPLYWGCPLANFCCQFLAMFKLLATNEVSRLESVLRGFNQADSILEKIIS